MVFAKANEDIEAALELLGEVGGIHTSDCTLANSGRGCNSIAKLLKRLMVIRRIAPPKLASSLDALHANARRLNQDRDLLSHRPEEPNGAADRS